MLTILLAVVALQWMSCKPKGASNAAAGGSAEKAYVAPGKYDEAGESFGEPPLFDGGIYPASAEADEDSVVIRLRKENFLQLLKENFDIHFLFTQTLARRLRFKSLISKEISSYGPGHRVSTLLHEYKKSKGVAGDELLKIELTRQQIADMTGLRVETVIRSIRELERNGHLKIERGKVYF